MKRRDFVKALVGGAVVALVPNLPRAEERLDVAALQVGLAGVAHGAKDMAVCLEELAASARQAGEWFYIAAPEGRWVRVVYDGAKLIST